VIIVRNCFVAKPGQAGKLAAQLKEAAATGELPNARILTDITGGFNRVVLEFEVETLAQFEALHERAMTSEIVREKMKGYTEHWTTGTREILRVF